MKELYLITGFLGAGKTTFLNMAAKIFSGKRIAVIVNEFGKQGIDGGLLSEKGYEVTEISNGSVFCVCRMDMFIDALTEAAKSPADLLLVETSGLSDPTNIDDILAQTKAHSGETFCYKGCICLVDAVNFEKVCKTAVVVPHQIMQSSLVVVNKTDLVSAEQTERIAATLRKLNPACDIYLTSFARIPRELLAGLKPLSERITGGKQDIRAGAFTFIVEGKPDISAFCSLMDGVKAKVYRCKGYVTLSDGQFFVDGVMDDISFTRVHTQQQDGIVLLYDAAGHVKKTFLQEAVKHSIEITPVT